MVTCKDVHELGAFEKGILCAFFPSGLGGDSQTLDISQLRSASPIARYKNGTPPDPNEVNTALERLTEEGYVLFEPFNEERFWRGSPKGYEAVVLIRASGS